MNRRNFLSALIAAGTAAAVDPERLLWTPGRKLISIPKPPLVEDWTVQLRRLKRGDVFTISGVYMINQHTGEQVLYRNPVNGREVRRLERFVVTSDFTGTIEPNLFPPIIPYGPHRNVSNAPAPDARVELERIL